LGEPWRITISPSSLGQGGSNQLLAGPRRLMVADQPGNLPAFGGSRESSKRHPEKTPLRGTCGHFILPFVGHFIIGVTISHKMAGQFMLPVVVAPVAARCRPYPATVLVRSA